MNKKICVYCGSSSGRSDIFLNAAQDLGNALVQHNYDLVYGGASIGLMGTVADAVIAAGGKAYGVIPRSLTELEIAHANLEELHVTDSMHERKSIMAELSDAFIAMAGGLGTLDELFEMWTWGQLGFHHKPIGLLNTNGYYDHLSRFLDHACESGFVRQSHRDMVLISDNAPDLVEKMKHYRPSADAKIMLPET